MVRRRDGLLWKIGADVNWPTYGDVVKDASRREVGALFNTGCLFLW
jgi:hypothetical protein